MGVTAARTRSGRVCRGEADWPAPAGLFLMKPESSSSERLGSHSATTLPPAAAAMRQTDAACVMFYRLCPPRAIGCCRPRTLGGGPRQTCRIGLLTFYLHAQG